MADFDGTFLEEQLERMRRLTERMSQVHNRVVENSASIARDRELLHSPASNVVHDVRTHQSHDYSAPRKRRRTR
jgi:hypothetical protein